MDMEFLLKPERPSVHKITSFFLLNRFGDPLAKKSHRRMMTTSGSRLNERTKTRHFQRKFDKILKEDDEQVAKFVVDQLFDLDPVAAREAFSDLYEDAVREGRFALPQWLRLREIASIYKEGFPDHPVNIYFEYVFSLDRKYFDGVEMLLLMLVAYNEFLILSCRGEVSVEAEDQTRYFLAPLCYWIPEADEGRLSTTRYRVLNYLYKNRFHEQTRDTRILRGEPRWKECGAKIEVRTLNVDTAIRHFEFDLEDEMVKSVFKNLLHFVTFFEWVQLRMFEAGVSADSIVKTFSRALEIRERFYRELLEFSKQRGMSRE